MTVYQEHVHTIHTMPQLHLKFAVLMERMFISMATTVSLVGLQVEMDIIFALKCLLEQCAQMTVCVKVKTALKWCVLRTIYPSWLTIALVK
jgi:hypothetical protein